MNDPVEIETGENPVGSIVWLHGLGADGHDFEPIVAELRLPAGLPLRFVFPHAPVRPVTINNGMPMRAWFDVLSFDREGLVDEAGIRASSELVETLLAGERERGFAADRIALAGFSQGGAIALHAGLRYPEPLAGLMALSTYLPLAKRFESEVVAAAPPWRRNLPIFMAHGSFDPVLPLALGRESQEILDGAGFAVEWHEYPMAHAVCGEEIEAIRRWLLRIYGDTES